MPVTDGSINSAYENDKQTSSNHDDEANVLQHYSLTLCTTSDIETHCSPDGVRTELSRSQELQHASNMSSSNSSNSALSNRSLTSSALRVEVGMFLACCPCV